MKITWFGTASVAIETENDKILIDPYITLPGAENRTSVKDFEGYNRILLTHGHVDHLASVPKLLRAGGEAIVYATATPIETLLEKGVKPERLRLFETGDDVTFGDIRVKVLKGRHIHFDKILIDQTVKNPRMLKYAFNLPNLGWNMKTCPENGETVAYEIHAEGKTILLLGSLGLETWEDYPRGADLLVLPYQGVSNLIVPACTFIDRLKPKNVLLTHFDDAFPPISASIDTKPLKNVTDERFPKIRIVKPTAGKQMKF